MRIHPLTALLHTLHLALAGRLHFPRSRVGQSVRLDDNKNWIIFREAVVDPAPGQPPEAGAIFRPRFHVAGMSVQQNIRFSVLPIPFFIGLPGFRRKLWLHQPESGDFQGIYAWETAQDAENYAHSFAMRFMTRRSVPGSVLWTIEPTGEAAYERYGEGYFGPTGLR